VNSPTTVRVTPPGVLSARRPRSAGTRSSKAIELDAAPDSGAPRSDLHVYFVEAAGFVVGTTHPISRIEGAGLATSGIPALIVLGRRPSPTIRGANPPDRRCFFSPTDSRAASEGEPHLTSTLRRYVNVFMGRAARTALANFRGRLDERLARWLLMWHDRVLGDLRVSSSPMNPGRACLGSARPGVTFALHEPRSKKPYPARRASIFRVPRTATACNKRQVFLRDSPGCRLRSLARFSVGRRRLGGPRSPERGGLNVRWILPGRTAWG